MDALEFGRVYQSTYAKAVNVAYQVCGSRAIAEDAVQTTAVYFLERLETHQQVTPSLFCEYAARRAKSLLETERGSGRRPARVIGVGAIQDVELFSDGLAVCRGDEAQPYRQEEQP